MAVNAAPTGALASSTSSAIAAASTRTAAVAADRARAIELQQSDAASVTSLLASIAAHVTDAFADKTTIVGALSSAQAEFASDVAGPSKPSQGSNATHQATTAFAATVAKAALPHSVSFPTTTITNAVAVYADNAWKNAA